MIFETDLKRRPKTSSRAKGRLPDGSVLTVIGKQRGDFQLVEVVLEDGSKLEGWVNMNAIEPLENSAKTKTKTRAFDNRPAKRIVIPPDEGLLLRREPSFYFGVQLGGNFAIIQPAQTITENSYLGVGFLGGGFIGFYLDNNIPLRFEVNYLQFAGTDPNDVTGSQGGLNKLNYGFLEIAVVPAILVGDFELFGGIGYALGLGIASDPQNFSPNPGEELNSPADLSSLSGHVGAAYTFSLSRDILMSLKGRYTIHFKTSPILFMGFAGLVSFQLRG